MEDEIKVNEYIRSRNGHIGKVKSLGTYSFMLDFNGIEKEIAYDNVRKHSFNIIDLIKVRRLCKWKNCNRNKRMEII